jgi:hypothetical protein
MARELEEEINPPRRLRAVIRQVKRKMSRFLSWNPSRPKPPQPARRPIETLQVIPALAPRPDT